MTMAAKIGDRVRFAFGGTTVSATVVEVLPSIPQADPIVTDNRHVPAARVVTDEGRSFTVLVQQLTPEA